MQISDKVFVVTGGGNGIAREVVLQLLAKGARVAAVDLSDAALAETAELAAAGDRLSTHVLNITDRAAVLELPAAVEAAHGSVDGVLNIAGIIQRFVPIHELSFEEIERVFNVNFWGVVNVTKAFLPGLLARPEACVLNVSSMGGLVPVPGQGAYGASKAAVKLFTEGLFAELNSTNVHVSVVFPGGVGTNISANSGVAVGAATTEQSAAASNMTTAEEAGRRIVEAVEQNIVRVVIGQDAEGLDQLSRATPVEAITMVAEQMKALVSGND